MKSFGQFSESNQPDVPEFYKRVKTRHQYPVDKDAYTEIGHQAYTGGIGSSTNTELWVHHDDKIKRKKIPEWRPKATHGDMFDMDELHYPEGGSRRPSGRVDHDLKAISLTYDNKTPPSHISGIVQKLRKAHPDYVIKDYERNEIVNESLKKDIAKVLGTAAVAGAVAFGGGKVKNMFPKKPEVHIAQVNAAAPQITKPKASLIIPKDVKSKMPEVITKEPPGHKEFHARLQQHFGEEYPIIMTAAERNGIKATDHDHIATLFGIRKAENGKSGKEFGVLAPKALGKKGEGKEITLDRQAGWAAATVMSKYRSHISSGGKPEDFIPYLASKYAPAGASNDPTGLNKNWTKNVSGWRDVFHGKKDKITEEAKPKILTRLTNQLRSKGVSGAANVAIGKLRQFGILKKDSLALTNKGVTRNSMTPGERAKDRASKKSGNSPSKYTYNKQTNTAKLKDQHDKRLRLDQRSIEDLP